MSLDLGGQTVTVVRRTRTGVDELGNVVWSEATTTVSGCSVQPSGDGDEQTAGREQTTSRLRLYGPLALGPDGLDLTSSDAVEIGGVRYEITGAPQQLVELNGNPHHVEAILTRVTG